MSSVTNLLDCVWKNTNSSTGHSYERLNHAMRDALQLAIGSGFEFEEGDLAHILKSYRTGYWIGENYEWVYSLAVVVGNVSAIKEFESHAGRQAIIADAVNTSRVSDSGFLHLSSTRKRERLAVGFEFLFDGQRLRVNSFAKDNSYLNAAVYERLYVDDRYRGEKIVKRYKITRENVIADRKRRSEKLKAKSSE